MISDTGTQLQSLEREVEALRAKLRLPTAEPSAENPRGARHPSVERQRNRRKRLADVEERLIPKWAEAAQRSSDSTFA